MRGARTRSRNLPDDARDLRTCFVGSGWQFLSGISFYTCSLANAFADHHSTSAILMRRLIPRAFYPGRDRVGAALTALRYRSSVPYFDGVDWLPGPNLVRAIRFLRRQDPDVIVFQWWTGTVLHSYLVLALAARRRDTRVVVEFHEVEGTEEARHPFVKGYTRLMLRPLLAMAAGFVVHSEFDRVALGQEHSIGDKPIAVVGHGPYDHLAPSAPCDPDGPMQLLYFGTIRPYKGLEVLVRAFDQLSDADAARFRLTVVGETWEGHDLPLHLIAASPYHDRITLVNRYVTDDELRDHLATADAVVLPYLRSSASGPLAIAMHHGLPIVVTDVGGLREATVDYAGATLVPPDDVDALRAALLSLPQLRGERYRTSRGWPEVVEEYEAALAIILGRGVSHLPVR